MSWLDRLFKAEEIGWSEIGERFTRYRVLVTPWFRVFVHRLWCPNWHPQGHDHPWSFLAVVLSGGYYERSQKDLKWRGPGSILFRRAEHVHNVVTGAKVNWSIIVTGPKRRQWGFVDMEPLSRRSDPKADCDRYQVSLP